MKISAALSLILVAALAFAGGWYWGTFGAKVSSPTVAPAQPDNPEPPMVPRVFAQGKLLPRGGIVNVLAPPGQRLATILVEENAQVVAGETELATLASLEALAAQTDLAKAQADAAEQELSQKILAAENALQMARANTRGAELKLQQAESTIDLTVPNRQLEMAREQLDRIETLLADPQTTVFVSRSQVQDKELAIERAAAEFRAAQRQQELAVAGARLALDSARQAEAAAERSLAMLQKLRDESRTAELARQVAERQFTSARLVAPVSGTVLKVFVKPGEAATNTPLLQLGDLNHFECVAEIVDQFASRIAVGQRARLTHAALPRPVGGTVRGVSRIVGNSTLPNPSPLAMVDRRTVDVRIDIDDSDVPLVQRLVNLQVTVEIETPATQASGLDQSPSVQ